INKKIKIDWILCEDINEANYIDVLKDHDGILVPGGFGIRGAEGKMLAIKYARENKIPFLGICFGMQLCAIEFARNVLNIKDATSTEFDEDNNDSIIHYLEDQSSSINKGGTLRLGAYSCTLNKDSKTYKLYNKEIVFERHRHRYEFNNKYLDEFSKHGMIASGINSDKNLVEILELKDHPYFIACQFHPEFLSRPIKPHPLFLGFIEEANKYKNNK
ncbi:MAG: gamma-glutamyl-gamma-aminobutyrate hydrolase family protein, partial [Candidatus Caccosoma sp.]|nr:gamma-glutamyl-gamma-aminobutyrate hydrolase family protein [Candidatus Caccosoma sp.]